jgi:hypothetical protein
MHARVIPAHGAINCEKEKMASLLLSFAGQSLGAALGPVGAPAGRRRVNACVKSRDVRPRAIKSTKG